MATVAVDIDDTLYSFTGLARQIMADVAVEREDKALERCAYASWDEWRTPVDLIGLDAWMEIIGMSHDSEMILAQDPFPGAVDALDELTYAGHQLLYVSNRATETLDATRQWLMVKGFPAGDLHCTGSDKGYVTRFCQYMIDDRPKNIFEFLSNFDWRYKHGSQSDITRKAFALMAPYNRGMTDIPNLYLAPTWAVLRHFFVREGLLHADVPDLAR